MRLLGWCGVEIGMAKKFLARAHKTSNSSGTIFDFKITTRQLLVSQISYLNITWNPRPRSSKNSQISPFPSLLPHLLCLAPHTRLPSVFEYGHPTWVLAHV